MPKGKRITDKTFDRSGIPAVRDASDPAGIVSKKRRSGKRPEREKYRERNEADADTLAILMAYVQFGLHRSRRVPKWIEHVIASKFAKYLAGGGKVSLDKAFGLTGRQRAGHPIEKQKRLHKNVLAMLEAARLQVVYGLTIENAVAKVAADDPTLKVEVLLKEYKTDGLGDSLRGMIPRERKGRAEE